MAATLQITDGTTTIDLSNYILDYVPSSEADDNGLFAETCRADITDSTLALALAKIRSIQLLFTRALDYTERHIGVPVYVKFKLDSTETLYRAEIKPSRDDPKANSIEHDEQVLGCEIPALTFETTIRWTRTIGEADAEVELPLLNGSIAEKATGGVVIYNHADGTAAHDNRVKIAGADIGGVVEAGCRIELTNTYNNSAKDRKIIIGVDAKSSASNFAITALDGAIATGGTNAADANCSGGWKTSFTWATSVETLALTWTLATANLNLFAGHPLRVFLRTPTSNAGIYARMRVRYPATSPDTILAETNEVLLSADELQDLGELFFPPGFEGLTFGNLLDSALSLYVRKSGGSVLTCDDILFMPTAKYLELKAVGNGIAYNEKLLIDSMNDYIWSTSSGTGYVALFQASGAPILLRPGVEHNLVFAFQDDANVAAIARTHSVRVYYRPRRLTL